MLTLRLSDERGFADHGWLRSHHSFSFADYYDPLHMGFGNLRVINEDFIAPGRGFGTHGHQDMEIITYVTSGALAHKDSMGNIKTIEPGDIQRMSAGTGVQHSEFNPSSDTVTHLLQIWIEPDANNKGIRPSYAQQAFNASEKRGVLKLVASGDPQDTQADVVNLNANAKIYAGLFEGSESAVLALNPLRKTYVQLVSGALRVNGKMLSAGDAALLAEEGQLVIDQGQNAEVLVFDLAPV